MSMKDTYRIAALEKRVHDLEVTVSELLERHEGITEAMPSVKSLSWEILEEQDQDNA